MEKHERRKNMINIMSQNEEFIIIGLTGRTGSGCTETAKILSSNYQELGLPLMHPGANGFSDNSDREKRILQRYASTHWLKFDVVSVRSIITTFIIDSFDEFKKQTGIDEEILYNNINSKINNISKIQENITNISDRLNTTLRNIDTNKSKEVSEILKELLNVDINGIVKDEIKYRSYFTVAANAIDKLKALYHLPEDSDEGKAVLEKSRFIQMLEELLEGIACLSEYGLLRDKDYFWKTIKDVNKKLSEDSLEGAIESENIDSIINRHLRFVFVYKIIDKISESVHDLIIQNNISYTELFQKYGNSIRKYGEIVYGPEEKEESNTDIFSIPRKIVQFIKVLRHPFISGDGRPVRIAIDSIKSVFEADYLRQRYSSFYLIAISVDDNIRKKRLMDRERKGLNMLQIKFIDWNEYSTEGCKIYDKIKNLKEITDDIKKTDEYKFYEKVTSDNKEITYDHVRFHSYKNKLQQFYLQDVAASIESADIFISNNYSSTISKNMDLRWSIVRNVCLMMFPGLLLPTPIERCMQVAFAAKCNSGCLSRQVGAVVTDKEYNILSIGWNDVPCGDISCSYKNLVDLCKWEDKSAYSSYELEDVEFRKIINRFNHQGISKTLLGLPMRYCFKDVHLNYQKNPMRSRAMHAEEKALANCGDKCQDGYLFTTSSPCEMCTKNAKNHKIKKIYYIELYPGISETQYSKSGDRNNIAEHILFTGAIGRAYTKMYTPFMPHKDMLDMLGAYDSLKK